MKRKYSTLALAFFGIYAFSLSAQAVVPGHLLNAYVRSSSTDFAITDISFPITVAAPISVTGYYFAQDYGFKNGGEAYTGLQPHPDGTASVRFSTFGQGATAVDTEHCKSGADTLVYGITCGTDIPNYVVGNTYVFHVKRDKNDAHLWSGEVTNASTGQTYVIGAYRTPQNWGDITHTGDSTDTEGRSFVEFYENLNSCSDLPSADVTFGAPILGTGEKLANDKPWFTSSTCPQSNYQIYSRVTNGDLHITISPK